jgi:hypothetical protein
VEVIAGKIAGADEQICVLLFLTQKGQGPHKYFVIRNTVAVDSNRRVQQNPSQSLALS